MLPAAIAGVGLHVDTIFSSYLGVHVEFGANGLEPIIGERTAEQ